MKKTKIDDHQFDPTRWEFDEEVVKDYVNKFTEGWSGKATEIRFWQWLNLAHPNYVERNGIEAVKRLKKIKKIG